MIKNYIIGKLSTKTKGKEYLNAMTRALSPESIAKCDPSKSEKVAEKK